MLQKKWIALALFGFLGGCSSPPPPPPPPAPPPIKHQVNQMETVGIQMIQHGDRLIMIIPTDRYFEPMSSTVIREQRINLQQMASFVKNFVTNYPKSVVRVTGYSDRVFDQRTQLQLSQNYAEAIAVYIFNAGISESRIAIQSRGSNEPIAGEYAPKSMAYNRRVVVQVN